MSEVLSYSQFQEAMDAVNPKAVKKKFKDRKDKDIDNDGDVDSSDKYLHKRRKAISKAVKKEDMNKPMTSAERAREMQKKSDAVKRDAIRKMLDREREAKKARDVKEEKKCPPGQYYCEKSGECKPNSMKKEETLKEKGKGLYYNINKKRKEGRPMRKKGEKGAPSEDDFKSAAKTAKESQEWERENCHSKDHDCATLVEHMVWGIGKPLFERHAVPDDSGYVAWYDIEFEHGVESAVPTEDLKIYTTEAHEKKDKDKKKMLPAKKGKHSDEMDEESYSDAEIAKAVDIAKKMAGSNYTGAHNAIEKMKKGLASVGKVKYALKKAAENFETWKGLSISEVNNIVQDITSSAQDYIKLVEDGDLKSVDEPEVEPVKGMPLSFKQFKSKIGD